MWENERKIVVIRNIILLILILAIVAGLGFSMLTVRAGNREYDMKLSEASKQQQQHLNDEKQQVLDSIQAEYDKDLATVEKYLPGIVCWGDGLTAGSFGNVSYPDVLKDYIDKGICDAYDFYSTIDTSNNVGVYTSGEYEISIPVVNMGSGAETTGTVLGRSGAAPFKVSADFTIPANTEKVQISITSADGKDVNPLNGGDVGVNDVTVSGVKGTLSLEGNDYFFVRSEAGQTVNVTAGTDLVTQASAMYKDYIHVVWIGTYDGFTSPDDLVAQVKTLLSRQTSNSDRFIVIGLGSYKGFWESYNEKLDGIDAAMSQAFGNRYINLRKYLCSDGLADAGVSATAADRLDLKQGVVPESLRSASGSMDYSAKVYSLLGKLVYERMEKLGYFDEVIDELGIK